MDTRVQVIVEVAVQSELTIENARLAAQEAIENAVNAAVDIGFEHRFNNDDVSIFVVGVELEPTRLVECFECNGLFPEGSLNAAMFCDGADWSQPMEIHELCGTCFENIACAPGWGWSNDYNDPNEYELVGSYSDGSPEYQWKKREE